MLKDNLAFQLLLLLLLLINLQRMQLQTVPEYKPVFKQSLQARVVGGSATTIEKLGGYLVALFYMGLFTCGGSLVHERIVVTAAHCFLERGEIDQWIAEGGITYLDVMGQRAKVVAMIKSPAFRQEDLNMDVAVLKLGSPLIAPNIKPIKLCAHKWLNNATMTVSGWGLIDVDASMPQRQIRTVNVPVISNARCRNYYAAATTLTKSMFCAALLGKKDACTFDSGGPLVHKNELCGIVSFGIGCANPKFPGVYTNVKYIRPFIERAMKLLLKDA